MHEGNDQRRWGVTYAPEVRRKAVERRMQTACVALGKNMMWQGVVDIRGAETVLQFLQACAEREAELDLKDEEELAPYVQALDALKAKAEAEGASPPPPPPPPPPSPPPPPAKVHPKKPRKRKAAT